MDIIGEIAEFGKELLGLRSNNIPGLDTFRPVPAKCLDCGKKFITSHGGVPCPECGSKNVHLKLR
jgi:rRNA maturation endonuclease Nob1